MSILHAWDTSPAEAVKIQQNLRNQIQTKPIASPIRYVAGADISFNRFSDIFFAGIIVLDYNTLEVVAHSVARVTSAFPYIPGLLSFREIPSLLEAWKQLPLQPDVLVLDGHGIAHPRRLGIAAHFGLWIDRPTIGCAKKLLTGKFEDLPAEAFGQAVIYDKEEAIGVALRTKKNVKPVFVSPGHLCDIPSAVEVVAHCAGKYRIPEPTRQAHNLVNQARRGEIPLGVNMY